MPGHEEYEEFGTAGKSETSPSDCDTCQYIQVHWDYPGYWDTSFDAKQIALILRDSAIRTAWTKAWDEFKCPPKGKECKHAQSCSPKPEYFLIGAKLVVTPGPAVIARWQVYIDLGRKIKCVADAEHKDDVPQIPKPAHAKGPEEKGEEKGKGPGW